MSSRRFVSPVMPHGYGGAGLLGLWSVGSIGGGRWAIGLDDLGGLLQP